MTAPAPELSEEEITEITQGIYDGSLFTNAHLDNPNDPQLQALVFVGLTFENDESIQGKEDHSFVYQWMNKSLGKTPPIGRLKKVYPTFMTYKSCNRADHSRILDAYRALVQAKKVGAN